MIAALMVATVAAKAQFEPGTFTLQPKVGMTLAEVSADDTKFKAGIVAGFEGQYQINNWFGLSVGLLYTQEGSKFKGNDNLKLNLEYLNVPVMAKFYPTKGLSLNIGLQPGFMTKAKAKASGDVQFKDESGHYVNEIDCKDLCNKFDLSVPMSIAYEFGGGLSIEARYTSGLTNVLKNAFGKNASTREKTYDNKNEVLMLTLGYKFEL